MSQNIANKVNEMKLSCYVCGGELEDFNHYPYCSEECEKVMLKSRGFMCGNCESKNTAQLQNMDAKVGSGVLCLECNYLIINHKVIYKGKK